MKLLPETAGARRVDSQRAHRSRWMTVAVSLALLPATGMAQATLDVSDDGGDTVPAHRGAVLDEVVVRARLLRLHGLGLADGNGAASRLGQSMSDIPASVELIDSDAIAVKGDFSGLAAVTRATGIAASASPGNGGTAVSSRGFNGHGSVVHLYDGTRLYVGAGTVSFPADTWTVSRIEVLRGPGSVINGVGAIGATINYVPRKPSLDPVTSETSLTIGDNGLSRLAIGSGGGIGEHVGFRFDAVNHQSDGHVDRGDEDRTAVSGALLWQPSERLAATLSVDYANTDASPYWGTPLVDGDVPAAIRSNNYNVSDGLIEYEDIWPRLHIDWQVNDLMQLRSDTFYMSVDRHWRNVESYDYNPDTGLVDRSFYLEILHDQTQLGNRSDLLMDFEMRGMPAQLSVGAEFNQIDFEHTNNSPYSGQTTVDLRQPTPGLWADGVVDETTRDYETDTFQHAFFVDGLVELNDRWTLVAGLRSDHIDYERQDFARSNGQSAGLIEIDHSDTSWRLGVVYKPAGNTSLYAQFSTAVDGLQSLITATNPTLDLAEGEQVEVGVKQSLAQGKLEYTLALYAIDRSNLLSQDPGGVQRQIGEQRSRGVELDVFWLPLERVGVDFNLALIDPEYVEFVSRGNDFSGNTPRGVPETTANLWVTWDVLENLSFSSGVRYVGERYLDDANQREMPDYTVWDAALQWRVSDRLGLGLRGRNLSDTDDFVLAPYGNQLILGEDRAFDVNLSYVF